MSFVLYDIERSFCEYVDSNLTKGTGEDIKFEFPVTEIGSHTYSVEFISDTPRNAGMGRVIDGGSRGRFIESLAQIDIFRLPTSSKEPDVAGARKMLSNVTDLFKGSHYIPFKTYGSNPSATTVGTTTGAIKIYEVETAKQAFDPNPSVRRYSQTYQLCTKEIF